MTASDGGDAWNWVSSILEAIRATKLLEHSKQALIHIASLAAQRPRPCRKRRAYVEALAKRASQLPDDLTRSRAFSWASRLISLVNALRV